MFGLFHLIFYSFAIERKVRPWQEISFTPLALLLVLYKTSLRGEVARDDFGNILIKESARRLKVPSPAHQTPSGKAFYSTSRLNFLSFSLLAGEKLDARGVGKGECPSPGHYQPKTRSRSERDERIPWG